jgi:PAS domain S-box
MHPQPNGNTYLEKDGSPSISSIDSDKLNNIRNQNLFYQIVSFSKDFVSLFTIKGNLTFLNSAGRKLLGIGEYNDIEQFNITQLFTPEQSQHFENVILPSLKIQGNWAGIITLKDLTDLEEIPCHADFILMKDDSNGTSGFIAATLRDLRPELETMRKLEESEKRFRNLVQQAPVATAIYIGREMQIQWANDAMIRLWGKDRSVIGKTIRQSLPELDGQPFNDLLDQVFTTGKMYQATEDRGDLVVDGKLQTFYFNFSYKPLTDVEGNVYGILNMAIDVTEQVRTKKKLEESERNFRNLILQAPFGICLLTGDDMVVQIANDEYLQLVARESEEFIGRPIWDSIPEVREDYEPILQSVKNTGVPYFGYEHSVELIRHGRKETIFINIVYEPLYDEEGNTFGVMAIIIDITQQVADKQKIINAEERMRLAVDSAQLGTYEINLINGDVITSPIFNKLFDMQADKEHVDYVSKLYPDDKPHREKAHQIALQTGKLLYEARIVRSDNTLSWLQIAGQYYFDEQHKPTKVIGIVRDITERKNMEQELEHRVKQRTEELTKLNEELQQFTFVSSHDLKEPLRKIMVYGGMIKDAGVIKEETNKGHLEKILFSAERMTQLLNDLLNYSYYSKKGQSFEMIDLNEIVKGVLSDLELMIEQKEAQISFGQLPLIEGVSFQINQLFLNLLQNSLKFSRKTESPVIRIECNVLTDVEIQNHGLKNTEMYYQINVIDNGIGFRQDFAEKIFIVFQRLHNRDEYSGNGIGLSLCKKIMENHNGKIFAQSVPGEGSVFSVIIPQKQTYPVLI